MADLRPAAAGPVPGPDGDGTGTEVPDSGAMRWLDWAGGVAAVVLVIIVADIWTDGRLISARLLRWRGQDPGEGGGDVRPGPAAGD